MSDDSSDSRKRLTDEELSRRLDRLFDDGTLDSDVAQEAAAKHVGDYVLIRLLGCGAFGLVYLARHYRSTDEVALKVPRPEVLVDKELRARFTCETIAARRLVHPNIVPIFDVESSGATPFIAAAFCRGGNLRDWLNKYPNPFHRDWQSCVRLVESLATAVAYAHKQNVYHRDIKPENILLFPNAGDASSLDSNTPKLTDFGLAKIVTDVLLTETRASVFLGTAMYMPPEQLDGEDVRDAPETVDIYSLGVVLFEVLTSRIPKRHERYGPLLDPNGLGTPESLEVLRPDVPAALAVVCRACTRENPTARYQSASDLAADLRAVIENRPISVPKISIGTRLRFYLRQPKRVVECGRFMLWSHVIIAVWSIVSSIGMFVYDTIAPTAIPRMYGELAFVLAALHTPNAVVGFNIIRGRSWAIFLGLLLSLINLVGPLMAILSGPIVFAELYAGAPFFAFSIHLMLLICFLVQLGLSIAAVAADNAIQQQANPPSE